ncbi:MAG: MBL fold metallo-hydrolase [Myxococcota bacterium]|nr:MBL fold metallo-hydrolase [Myxococcota bacterium]
MLPTVMGRKKSPPALAKERLTRRKGAAGDGRVVRSRSSAVIKGRKTNEVEVLDFEQEVSSPNLRSLTMYDEPYRDFEYVGGIHLTNSILWCDADRKRDLTFISHARSQFVGKSRRILATDKTVKILTRKNTKLDALTSPYKRSFTIGPLRLELHPAGHVLGSSQLVIDRDDRRLVFASDICPRRSATVERAKPIACDSLVLCPSFGHPMYRFPDRDEVFSNLCQFIDDCLNENATPVLLANPIGTSQELMRRLGDAGYKLRVHASIYDVAKVYKTLGVSMHGSRRFSGRPGKDDVILFPPILKKHVAIRKLKKFKTAMISGRAVEPGYALQQRVDAAFPFSDAADYYELLNFIDETGADEIYLYGDRFVEDFGAVLRKAGKKVIPLVQPKQLSLL